MLRWSESDPQTVASLVIARYQERSPLPLEPHQRTGRDRSHGFVLLWLSPKCRSLVEARIALNDEMRAAAAPIRGGLMR